MKNLTRAVGVFLALAMALSMTACGPKEITQPEDPVGGEASGADTVKSEIPFLTFAASDSGGEWYTMSVAVNTILEDKLGIPVSWSTPQRPRCLCQRTTGSGLRKKRNFTQDILYFVHRRSVIRRNSSVASA